MTIFVGVFETIAAGEALLENVTAAPVPKPVPLTVILAFAGPAAGSSEVTCGRT